MNMAFFDDLGKKISQTTQNAVQKTKDMGDIAKINSAISEEEKKIAGIYSEIGKTYISLHKNNPEEGALAELVLSFAEAEANIEVYKKRIEDIKGVKRCEKCGAALSPDAAFCSSCGTAIPKPQTEPAPSSFCSGCGAPLSADIRFCTNCGKPVQLKVEVPAVEEAPVVEGASVEEIEVTVELSQDEAPEEKPTEDAFKFCSICGAKVPQSVIFCTNCGNKFAPPAPQNVCPSCGQESKPGMSFCTNCGTKL